MKTIYLAVMMSTLLAGCASSPTPNYDARFGASVRNAKAAMTINPEAGKQAASNPEAATMAGIDGKAARESMMLYQGTYKAPPPAVNVINIGGQVGGRGPQ